MFLLLRHIGLPNIPKCECKKINEFQCKGANVRVTYPHQTDNVQKSSIFIHIPGLSSASYWTVTTYLKYSNLNSSMFDFEASGDWNKDWKGSIRGIIVEQKCIFCFRQFKNAP